MKLTKQFWLVAIDGDKNTFSIDGVTVDDRAFTNRIWDEQQKGRNIRCNTPEFDKNPREFIISQYENMGFTFSEHSVI